MGVDAELDQRRAHLRGRGSPTGRAEDEVHERGERPPERDRGERAVGQRGAEVERRDRDEQHEQLPEAPHRAGEVGRRDRDHGDDHRHAHGRERRRVVPDTGDDVERLLQARVLDDQRADDPSRAPTPATPPIGEVARQAPPAGHQRGDHHEAERPQRAERVERWKNESSWFGSPFSVVKRFCSNVAGVVLVPDGEDEDRRRR